MTGRFMTPDPLPWAHWQNGSKDDQRQFDAFIANPQNLNAYAYVLNNPLNSIDPDGQLVYIIAYTTGNSEGDEELKRAAQTKYDEIRSFKDFDPKKDAIVIGGVKTKEDFQNLLTAAGKIEEQFGKTTSVSLFSHAGNLDGPVFHDASRHPSQLTQGELANLKVNWAPTGTEASLVVELRSTLHRILQTLSTYERLGSWAVLTFREHRTLNRMVRTEP
jgi:hypothetical protein